MSVHQRIDAAGVGIGCHGRFGRQWHQTETDLTGVGIMAVVGDGVAQQMAGENGNWHGRECASALVSASPSRSQKWPTPATPVTTYWAAIVYVLRPITSFALRLTGKLPFSTTLGRMFVNPMLGKPTKNVEEPKLATFI